MLMVPDTPSDLGLGGQLIQQAETEALAGSSHPAWVYTQFGARGFYWRLGCAVFGELPYYPRGFMRSFLRKRQFTPGGAGHQPRSRGIFGVVI